MIYPHLAYRHVWLVNAKLQATIYTHQPVFSIRTASCAAALLVCNIVVLYE